MAVLYLIEPGSIVKKRGERFIVEKDGKELLEVEARKLETILMLSSVQVTTQALCEMLDFGIEFAILSRSGKLLGQLTPPLARNIFVRKAQFLKESDHEFAMKQAAEIVFAKIENSRQVLLRHVWQESNDNRDMQDAIARMGAISEKVASAGSIGSLMGLEGGAAKIYWSVFGQMLKVDGLGFEGRKKHPSPDPVNAVLSFGYVLLTNALQSLLDGMGFDPFLGFFHEEVYGRASLALDLVEPFRAPVVDRFAIRIFNLGTIRPDDFDEDPEGGLRLRRPALKKFFGNWEKHLARMKVRTALREQAEQLAGVFTDRQPLITPWRWRAKP